MATELIRCKFLFQNYNVFIKTFTTTVHCQSIANLLQNICHALPSNFFTMGLCAITNALQLCCKINCKPFQITPNICATNYFSASILTTNSQRINFVAKICCKLFFFLSMNLVKLSMKLWQWDEIKENTISKVIVTLFQHNQFQLTVYCLNKVFFLTSLI